MTDLQWLVVVLGCKATLILGLVAGLFALTGRRWPQNCRLWQRLGVVALLVLPVAAWALPTLSIPLLPAPRPITVADREKPPIPSANSAAPSTDSATADGRGVSPAAGASLAANVSVKGALQGFARSKIRILVLCFAAVYGVVVVMLVIRFVGAWHGLSRLKRASSLVVDPAWQSTLERWSAVLQVARPVELRMSDTVSVPMTFGWRAPVILIPGDCLSACDQTMRDAIVVHELSHIAQGDFFWQAMTRLAAAMYWMHPLAWLVSRQDRTLCERICDALCSQRLSRESYARSLVLIAGRKIFRPAAALGIAMAHPSSLGRRLMDLETCATSGYRLLNRSQRMLLGATAGLILGLIVAGTLSARAAVEGTYDDQPPKTDIGELAAPAVSVRLPATIDGQVFDQQEKPIANAEVFLSVQRVNPQAEAAAAPARWTASTDDQGHYRLPIGAPSLRPDDWLRLKIRAPGFADVADDFDQKDAQGSFPPQRLYAGRTVRGRLVDPQGNPVAVAAVRFQASTEDMKMIWDSGPQVVDKDGTFSVSIPNEGRAAGVIYPRGLAPQFVDVPEKETDLGTIQVERGTSLTGRVVDKQGRGVAGTVVALQSEERRRLFLYAVLIGNAVKTDDNGRFRFPPVRGTYHVLATSGGSDFSRRCFLRGPTPPPILPQRIALSGEGETREVILREAGSVTVRGTVRWADGSPVPDALIRSAMNPDGWKSGVNLAYTSTDSQGAYVQRLPAPAERVIISVDNLTKAPDGTFQQAIPVVKGADSHNITIDLLTDDVEDADWVVGPRE